MNKDLGRVRPLYGRWTWPFVMMEEGDWFTVAKEDREPERVRHLVSVRAAQTGKRFKVEKSPPDCPGFTKVTCVPDDYEPEDRRAPVLQYGDARERLKDLYGINLDELDWRRIEAGERVEVRAQCIDPEDISKRKLIVELWAKALYDLGVELKDEGVSFVVVPKGWKVHIWEAKSEEHAAWLARLRQVEHVERSEPDSMLLTSYAPKTISLEEVMS